MSQRQPGPRAPCRATFTNLKTSVDAQLPATIQAYAITWTFPFRVDNCMSVTAAFTYGYLDAFCNGTWPLSTAGCKSPTGENGALYTDATTAPFTDTGLRPAMMIAGASAADAEAVIDRGVAADGTYPQASAYLVRTSDQTRSARWGEFSRLAGDTDYPDEIYGNPADVYTAPVWDPTSGVALNYIDNSAGTGSDDLSSATGVLFYLTGLAITTDLETNQYLPGSIGDSLTSYGGVLNNMIGGYPTDQTTVLTWLMSSASTGLTASYGTVLEPCGYFEKFADAIPLMESYYEGATAIEAYWKSVAAPYEGLFVGEPLARPFGHKSVSYANGTLTIQTTALQPGASYLLQSADAAAGPWTTAQTVAGPSANRLVTIAEPGVAHAFYQLALAPPTNNPDRH